MKSWLNPFAAVMVLAVLPIAAQWPNYSEKGVPRDSDGKVKLDAPAPKAPDGHPDLSGVWDLRGTGGRGGPGGPGAPKGGPGGPKGGPPKGGPPPELPPGTPPNATFKSVGSGFKDGLPMLPWAADLLKARRAENSKDNPDAHCLPLGLMQLHMHPQPRKIIQTPGLIVMLYEAQGGIRQIFTDGRPLPNDAEPWWYGYSIGHWEDDTLVVETTGFRNDVWLDIDGSPLTESGKMTERMKRLNYGTLQTDITIEDPKTYTKPFTVRVTHRLLPDTDLIEFICTENDRSGPHLVGK
jgi:hypothetical protein